MTIRYSDFVNYSKLDPVKRMALELFEATLIYPERLGIKILPQTLGETAIGFDFSGIGDTDFSVVTNVEGLGTKNLIADAMYKETKDAKVYTSPGQDAVAMSINDLVALGADPFAYSDMISCGASTWFDDLERTRELLMGYRIAADTAKIAIPQGETPELRGIINPDTLDLNGASIGLVRPKSRLVMEEKISENDVIYGLASSGIHANGLSKARKIAEKLHDGFFTKLQNGKTLGEELLTPTRIYARAIIEIFEDGVDVHYLQPITGHGWEKIARAKSSFTYRIENVPEPPLIFQQLIDYGKHYGFDVSNRENYHVWNMGVGYIIIAPSVSGNHIAMITKKHGIETYELGKVEKGPRQVIMPFEENGKPVIYEP
ncbi:MAG: AIR synthase-related protein [Candidatus Aenigmarchaeota archaeon]|nr:AIR synthase-related protein [Candidatus Aenigmarchaeota archaeon]